MVVELKRGQTPRDVTSQALEYSTWAKDLDFDEVTHIADSYLGDSGSLEKAFRERFEAELPDQLNEGHRSLIVAESVDASTDRIVRYLAELGVPINVATVQHFEDAHGRELLAQVYLIEPEAVQPRARRTSARSGYRTVNELQALVDEKGIGEIYRRLRDGVRGIFFAQGYSETVAYVRRLESGGVRTMMLVEAVPGDDAGGVKFVAHAIRFEQYMNVGKAHRLPSHISKTVLSTVHVGGAEGTRTPDFLRAREALSQLSYSPMSSRPYTVVGCQSD